MDKLIGKEAQELIKKGHKDYPVKSVKIKVKFDTKKKELAKKMKGKHEAHLREKAETAEE